MSGGALDPAASTVGRIITGGQIIDTIELGAVTREDVLQAVFGDAERIPAERVFPRHMVSVVAPQVIPGLGGHIGWSFDLSALYSAFVDGMYVGHGRHAFAAAFMLRLDGQTRLALTNPQPVGDLLGQPQNLLMTLFVDQQARERVRAVIADAFPGLYFVIDPTAVQQLRIRMARRAPADPSEEQSLDPRSREFHRQGTLIEQLSDGVKAFTGLVAAVFSANYKVVLIDEPEAFLYPPLARKLGALLAQVATERGGSVFAATHSPEFLMGCVQTGRPVNVVRLIYSGGVPGARIVPGADLQHLMRDPLLRSTGVLGALFHAGAVVCEGGVDRAFYEEVNRRLLAADRGAGDVLFLDGIGKQSLHTIIAPLRRLGVPAAVIVDLDILKRGDLRRLLLAASVPVGLADTWSDLRRRVLAEFDQRGLDPKEVGIQALDAVGRAMAESLIASVAQYGVFVVPVGEVERWLAALAVAGEKGRWLMAMFERMGADPSMVDYVRPAAGDVWAFVDTVASWIRNPARLGIPA